MRRDFDGTWLFEPKDIIWGGIIFTICLPFIAVAVWFLNYYLSLLGMIGIAVCLLLSISAIVRVFQSNPVVYSDLIEVQPGADGSIDGQPFRRVLYKVFMVLVSLLFLSLAGLILYRELM